MMVQKEKFIRMFRHACAFAECGEHCEIEPLSKEQKWVHM